MSKFLSKYFTIVTAISIMNSISMGEIFARQYWDRIPERKTKPPCCDCNYLYVRGIVSDLVIPPFSMGSLRSCIDGLNLINELKEAGFNTIDIGAFGNVNITKGIDCISIIIDGYGSYCLPYDQKLWGECTDLFKTWYLPLLGPYGEVIAETWDEFIEGIINGTISSGIYNIVPRGPIDPCACLDEQSKQLANWITLENNECPLVPSPPESNLCLIGHSQGGLVIANLLEYCALCTYWSNDNFDPRSENRPNYWVNCKYESIPANNRSSNPLTKEDCDLFMRAASKICQVVTFNTPFGGGAGYTNYLEDLSGCQDAEDQLGKEDRDKDDFKHALECLYEKDDKLCSPCFDNSDYNYKFKSFIVHGDAVVDAVSQYPEFDNSSTDSDIFLVVDNDDIKGNNIKNHSYYHDNPEFLVADLLLQCGAVQYQSYGPDLTPPGPAPRTILTESSYDRKSLRYYAEHHGESCFLCHIGNTYPKKRNSYSYSLSDMLYKPSYMHYNPNILNCWWYKYFTYTSDNHKSSIKNSIHYDRISSLKSPFDSIKVHNWK